MLEQGTLAGTRPVARRKVGLYIHATVYVAVNVLLITINLSTAQGQLWFQWPLLGWGIGLLAHAAAAFSLSGRRREWRAIRRQLRREWRAIRAATKRDLFAGRRQELCGAPVVTDCGR
jgi:hypothetical protein